MSYLFLPVLREIPRLAQLDSAGQLLSCETQPCIVHRAGQANEGGSSMAFCRTQGCVTWPSIMALA